MLARLLTLFAIALQVSAECGPLVETRTGRIEVQAYAAGRAVTSRYDFQLLDLRTQKPIQLFMRPGGVAEQVPYGEYLLRVEVQGGFTAERIVRLQQPALTIRMLTQTSLGECWVRDDSLHGTVTPAPEERELWLKAIPVHGTGGGETRVGSHGNFLIGGLTPGKYVLLLMEGTSVLHTEVVDSAPDRVVTLRLTSTR